MSIQTHKMSPNPRLTQELVRQGAFAEEPFVVIDVGARGGAESHWKTLGDQCRIVGFEPDQDECARLNQSDSSKNCRYFPVALHRGKGTEKLHIYSHRASSSFYLPNSEYLKRFPDIANLSVDYSVEVETTDLDSFVKDERLPQPDFIKLDTEGSEFDILKGGQATLGSVLGVTLETSFQPFRIGQAPFSEVDQFMRSQGFSIFDFPLFRSARNALSPYTGAARPGPTDFGQVFWGQVLYFRDAVADFTVPEKRAFWTEARVLKLASLMELFGFADCAVELIMTSAERGVIRKIQSRGRSVAELVDFALPLAEGKSGNYQEYMERLKEQRWRPPSPKPAEKAQH